MATQKKETKKQTVEKTSVEPKKSDLSVRVDKLFDDPSSKLKAVFSANLPGGFAVHGIKVYENEKGRWISMPQSSYKTSTGDTVYEDIFHPTTAESRNELNSAVSKAYDEAITQHRVHDVNVYNDSSEESDLGVKT